MEYHSKDDIEVEKPINLDKMNTKAENILKEKEKPKIKPHHIFKDFKMKRKGGKF